MFHLLCREMRKGKITQCLGFTWCYRGAASRSQKTSINPAKFHLHHHFSPKAGTRHVSSPNFWRNARRVWAPDPSAAVDQHILTIQQCYTVTMNYCNDTMQVPDCGVCDCDGVLGTGIKSQPTPSQRTHPPTRGGNQINLDEKPSSRYLYVKGKVKRDSCNVTEVSS